MFMEAYTKIKSYQKFINNPKYSKYYNGPNILVVGKMENGTSGMPIKGFVRLKAKMYTFITEGNHEPRKAKSINKMLLLMMN